MYGLLILDRFCDHDPFAQRAGDDAKLYQDVGGTRPHWIRKSKRDGVLKVMMRMDWWTEMRLFVSVVLV